MILLLYGLLAVFAVFGGLILLGRLIKALLQIAYKSAPFIAIMVALFIILAFSLH